MPLINRSVSNNHRQSISSSFRFVQALFVVSLLFAAVGAVQTQTLKADYRFQNSRTSTVGSSSLTDTGSNTFQTELVDGISRTVLRFPFNNGLRLSSATGQIPNNSYTIVMLLKFDSVAGFVRLVDFKNRSSDNGLYIDNGHLESCTSCTNFSANTYIQVVYTRTSGGTFAGYVNGTLQGQGPDAGNDLVIDGSNILNFFQDDLAAGNEASAGSVARIRLYDAPMNASQVAALDREPAAPTSFTVTNTNDSGLGSFRQALLDANANVGTDTITFNIPGSGVQTISPLSPLPVITGSAIIDGATQPGYAGTPLIELNGSNAGAVVNGLHITAGNSTVRGLIINRFGSSSSGGGAGIILQTNGNNIVEANYIGTNNTGTAAAGQFADGIFVSASSNNRIGGVSAAQRNLISGNGRIGIYLLNGSANTLIQGNFIGTNAAGTAALGNGSHGVMIQGAANNTVGGTAAGAGNVISGNAGSGVEIDQAGATGNIVQGNFIGTNAAGNAAIGNSFSGVQLTAPSNTIGGTSAGSGNVISGNLGSGVLFNTSSSNNNIVRGNFIGTNPTGTAAIPNTAAGITVFGISTGNIIGGTLAGSRNVISGNIGRGISISGNAASGNFVQGNFIGVAADGVTALANTGTNGFGVVMNAAPNNTIGGATAQARNIISANDQSGILLQGVATTGNLIQGNYVGTDVNGTSALPNSGVAGVYIRTSANNNTIGGLAAGAGNRIHFNAGNGVRIQDSGSIRNAVLSNSIFSNGRLGIHVQGGGNNDFDPDLISPLATSGGGTTTIQGLFAAAANTTFAIQYFSNAGCDPSGFGEGETLIGTANATTGAGGTVNLNQSFGVTVPTGQFVTATATDPQNNTSRFSPCLQVNGSVLISGTVKNSSNIGIGGVTMTMSGSQAGFTTTDANGSYSFRVIPGTYTVTPAKINLIFAPQSTTVSSTTTADFTATTMPGPAGKIVFISFRDGNNEIYSMNPDGSNQTRLVNNTAEDRDPTWSPNGAKIAFESDRTLDFEIFSMNADGTGQTNLTNNPAFDDSASWSPDGSKIAFSSDRNGNQEIYVMNQDGTNPVRLTNNPAIEEAPAWSPDGTRIAFSSDRDGNTEIYVMNADGSNQVRLTNNSAFDDAPAWSPDSSRIAFHTNRDGNFEIYAVNTNGSNLTRITSDTGADTFPSYSADGSQITFAASRDPQGDAEIYVMGVDGRTPTNISNFPLVTEGQPTWQTQAALPASFRIDGRVVDALGNGIGNLFIGVTGGGTFGTVTDAGGFYSFTSLAGGADYVVTPASGSNSFSPANFTFTNLSSNRIGNFVATQTQVSIAGTVVDGSDVALNNITLMLTKNGTLAGTTQTNVLGSYSFSNLEAGANYVVTPAGTFSPASQNLSNLTVSATANFKAAASIPSQCNTLSFGRTDFSLGTAPTGVVSGDFNGDGRVDLAAPNFLSSNVSVLLATGPGTFASAVNFPTGVNPIGPATAELNGDGILDLVVANFNASGISVLLGTGNGTFGAPTSFSVGTRPRSVAVGDFNNDGKLDLAVSNQSSDNVSVLLGTGTGTFNPATSFPVGSTPLYVAVGDFNNDGVRDLVVANGGTDNVSILIGNGSGNFATAANFPAGDSPFAIGIGDFNSDGKADLAAANNDSTAGGTTVAILLATGAGVFGSPVSVTVGTNPSYVATSDFNGDGKLDLAVAHAVSNDVVILMGTGAGTFASGASFAVNNSPRSIALGDFNSDGKVDLAASNQSSNDVSVLLNSSASCNTQTSLSISGKVTDARMIALPEITVTLSGPITRVTQTDGLGNYSFNNLVPGGNYSVTLQSSYFVFAPSRADFFNLGSSQVANFIAAPLAVPSPTPTPNDDFSSTVRDASKWSIGTQTSPSPAFDPQVTTAQVNGQLVISPLTQASGMHYGGYVSANSFDMRNGSARVEVVKAATGGADTIFAIGSDADNFHRFLIHTAGGPTGLAPVVHGPGGFLQPLDTTVSQLIFQVAAGGPPVSVSIPYDPVQHRFMRFRHVAITNSIVFETSPDDIDYTVRHTVVLQRSVSAITAELSAGTSNPANPGATIFDNFGLVTSTFQFSASSYVVGEGDGSILVTVTRSGSLADAAAVDFSTTDGTARQKTKYTSAAGTLAFAAGVASRTFRVLLIDNQLAEGEQTLNLLLSNPVGSGLNSPGRALLTISDNDTTLATTNSLDDARYFVTQHYYDFLSRVPDQSGLDFWISQITQCGTDAACLRIQRITVSNAFFYEQEYQQTGSYVVRLYRAAYGNNQPISNTDANPQFPNENKKLVNYSAFSTDRARVRGGPSLAQTQLELANAFVLRSQFLARYPSNLDGPAYVDALLATIANDLGVDLSSQRTALIDLFNQGGRGAVLYRLADDNTMTNPINNRALVDAEYNRAFVLTQYFGYLRRNPDIGGFVFWLGQVNSAPLRSLDKQRAMVCSFITSLEYQQRFSPVATHNNTECP
jgi:hypothetical protein